MRDINVFDELESGPQQILFLSILIFIITSRRLINARLNPTSIDFFLTYQKLIDLKVITNAQIEAGIDGDLDH